MKIPPSVFSAAAFVGFLFIGFSPSLALTASAKESVLVNFKDTRRDPDGTLFHPYEYVFGEWSKHVSDLSGRGVLIQASAGTGGLGENKTGVDFSDCTTVELNFVIGNSNHAKAIRFSLEDKDGTDQSWTISLADYPLGREIHAHFDLSKAESVDKPGKTPGLNLKKITTWQIKGDYAASNVEILLIKLSRVP